MSYRWGMKRSLHFVPQMLSLALSTLGLLSISVHFEKQFTPWSLVAIVVVIVFAKVSGSRPESIFVLLTFFTFSFEFFGGTSLLLADLGRAPLLLVFARRALRVSRSQAVRLLLAGVAGYGIFLATTIPALLVSGTLIEWSAYSFGILKIAVGFGYMLLAGCALLVLSSADFVIVLRSAVYIGTVVVLSGGLVYTLDSLGIVPGQAPRGLWFMTRFQGGHLDAGLMSLQFALLVLIFAYNVAVKPKQSSAWIALGIFIIGVSMGGARSALLGLVIALGFFTCVFFLRKEWERASVGLLVSLATIGAGLVSWFPGVKGPLGRLGDTENIRIFGGESPEGAVPGLWQTAWQMFIDSHGLGVGWGQFLFRQTYPHLPHNTPLLVLAEGGIFMVVFVVLIGLGLAFRTPLTSPSLLVASAVLLTFVAGQFLDLHTTRIVWLVVGFWVAVCLSFPANSACSVRNPITAPANEFRLFLRKLPRAR